MVTCLLVDISRKLLIQFAITSHKLSAVLCMPICLNAIVAMRVEWGGRESVGDGG